jgi:hypothetical protein
MLLVATGVGIGRWTAAPDATKVATSVVTPPVIVTPGATAGSEPAPAAGGGGQTSTSEPPTVSRGVERSGGNRSVAENPERSNPSTLRNGNQTTASPSSAYQLTAVQHLSEAEALLTSFRTRSNTDQQMDAQLGAWARQLLSNTRLLLDSPVANDPQRRPLLQDLELVLVQIVQLSPGSTPQDRELIEKTLKQDHVMTRLRTAIPAGSQRGS